MVIVNKNNQTLYIFIKVNRKLFLVKRYFIKVHDYTC